MSALDSNILGTVGVVIELAGGGASGGQALSPTNPGAGDYVITFIRDYDPNRTVVLVTQRFNVAHMVAAQWTGPRELTIKVRRNDNAGAAASGLCVFVTELAP